MEMKERQNDVFDHLNSEHEQTENCSEIVKHNVDEYADLTGIHGIRYLTEKRSYLEKIIWWLIILLAIAGCFYMIYEILDKYLNSPVLLTFGVREVPIFEIPFPAITICPLSRIPKSLFDYHEILKKHDNNGNLTDTEKEYFSYIRNFCDPPVVEKRTPIESPPISEKKFYKFLKDAESQMFLEKECQFKGKDANCNQILHKTLTDMGVCYSFNILDGGEIFRERKSPFLDYYNIKNTTQWTIDNGYYKNVGIETYPQRALFYGADDGFNILLTVDRSESDISCSFGLNGFLVHLHNPAEIPLIERNAFALPLDQVVTVAVTPELITTSDDVKYYTPEQRQCYFQHEKQLKYFKIYNQVNCNLECYTIYTYKKCGCAQFFMPRDSNVPLCQPEHEKCTSKAEEDMKYDQNIYKNYTCDCLPLCSELNYNIQLSQSKYYWQNFYKNYKDAESSNISMSYLTIYFKHEQFFKQERNELYGIFDLISNFGGLLGLFTGWTLISIPELLYFLSLRWIFNIYSKKERLER